ITFPALSSGTVAPFLDAYAVFDYLSAFILVLLAISAKKIAPLYTHSWAIVITFVAMISAVCINFASIY
ncbi:MAG: hypothetical protein RR505_06265, partial [Raoultibacter sp.]